MSQLGLLSFDDVLITPYTELLQISEGKGSHRGGPHWPDWDRQTMARHNRDGMPVDDRPLPPDTEPDELAEQVAWAGPAFRHYGHQLAEFSMRLYPTLLAWPAARFVFGTHREPIRTIDPALPHLAFFGQILDWYDISIERVTLLDRPVVARSLVIAPQAEQLPNGPSASPDYLSALDVHTRGKVGRVDRSGTVYVSRAGTHRPLGGESYLEEALRAVGVDIFHPESTTVPDQVRRYLTAERLIFAEGSALHTLQLAGHQDADVLVLNRRPNQRLAEGLLRPRLRSLRYSDASSAMVMGTAESQQPAPWHGLPLLDPALTLDALAAFGVDVRSAWSETAFAAATEHDFSRWLDFEGRQPRAALPAWRPSVARSLEAVGMGHLTSRLPAIGSLDDLPT